MVGSEEAREKICLRVNYRLARYLKKYAKVVHYLLQLTDVVLMQWEDE